MPSCSILKLNSSSQRLHCGTDSFLNMLLPLPQWKNLIIKIFKEAKTSACDLISQILARRAQIWRTYCRIVTKLMAFCKPFSNWSWHLRNSPHMFSLPLILSQMHEWICINGMRDEGTMGHFPRLVLIYWVLLLLVGVASVQGICQINSA